MEKKLSVKFYGGLVICHEVMKLQSFEFDLSDVILFCIFSLDLWGKNLVQSFMVFFIIFHEVIKLRCLNDKTVSI